MSLLWSSECLLIGGRTGSASTTSESLPSSSVSSATPAAAAPDRLAARDCLRPPFS
eukprot:CAMPEP_0206544180 /NCGR_PEP_ID=MMETSP0325_2-20121206/11361_1 /ASSEMBLY_ACC=CAM_ASM_000347 /TAXON_ID=2866 /ORGANISM="Crypthecodinium cohnii, Strain Seligo" /LENGTH=55 /DNA_ID=CAMNT_0054042873 /DNA_START=92 /DNA_END=259 /DNA_ORIENTATION=+